MSKVRNSRVTLCVQAAVAGLMLTAGGTSVVLGGEKDGDREKCYGVAKAGGNDCATANSVCTGHSTEDRQADAWIWLPKGTCERLVGGGTKPR